MPSSSHQDRFARHHFMEGVPLWSPAPDLLPSERQSNGLKIGDVGIIDGRGRFEALFNTCSPIDPALQSRYGLPSQFERIDLPSISPELYPPHYIFSSPKTAWRRSQEGPHYTSPSAVDSSRIQTEYTARLSEDSAHIVVPDGARSFTVAQHDLHRFENLACCHWSEWSSFVKEYLHGRSVTVYLITGLCQTSSWALASFSKRTEDQVEVSCKLVTQDKKLVMSECEWTPSGRLESKIGANIACQFHNSQSDDNQPHNGECHNNQSNQSGGSWSNDNQTIFVQTIAITPNGPELSTVQKPLDLSVKHTDMQNDQSGGITTARRSVWARWSAWLVSLFRGNQGNTTRTRTTHEHENSATIRHVPKVTLPFHPSEVINQYLLKERPLAKVAITHDSIWMTMLAKGWLLNLQELESNINNIVSKYYLIVFRDGITYLEEKDTTPAHFCAERRNLAVGLVDNIPRDVPGSRIPVLNTTNREHGPNVMSLQRKYIDLICDASLKWVNWDPFIPVKVGSYGEIEPETGRLRIEGNIYDNEFQLELDKLDTPLRMADHPPQETGIEDDHTIASKGAKRVDLNPVPQVSFPDFTTASIKGQWQFERGKRGALLIMRRPRMKYLPERTNLETLFKVPKLKDKYLVTSVHVCPAFLMYLSDKSGEKVSLALLDQSPVPGVTAGGEGAVGWWSDDQGGLIRTGYDKTGRYCYSALYTMKRWTTLNQRLFERGETEEAEGNDPLEDVVVPWGPLNEEGEELSTLHASTALSSQDKFARHNFPEGIPLWSPAPDLLPPERQSTGLKIGDVGIIDGRGRFEALFNTCNPPEPALESWYGLPPQFERINLQSISPELYPPHHIFSSPKTAWVRSQGEPHYTGLSAVDNSHIQTEYTARLSEDSAHIVVPDGARSFTVAQHDLHRFENLACCHWSEWSSFVKEYLHGRSVTVYLITGLCQTSSWALASFSKRTEDQVEVSCKLVTQDKKLVVSECEWTPSGRLDGKIGANVIRQSRTDDSRSQADNNQTIFIRAVVITSNGPELPMIQKQLDISTEHGDTQNDQSRGSSTTIWSAYPSSLGSLFRGHRGNTSTTGTTRGHERSATFGYVQEVTLPFHPTPEVTGQYLLKHLNNIAITHDSLWMSMLARARLLNLQELESNINKIASGYYSIIIRNEQDIASGMAIQQNYIDYPKCSYWDLSVPIKAGSYGEIEPKTALINTASGRLLGKAERAQAFESYPTFKELISSKMTPIDIAHDVMYYYRYALFSHRWGSSEPDDMQVFCSAWTTRAWIFQELMETMGISAEPSMALRPGLEDTREKLCLASTRILMRDEDMAYSLLGIFSPVVYGDRVLRRLLAQSLTSSGDAIIWTGQSSGFNSYLPLHISVSRNSPASHIMTPRETDTMTAKLCNPSPDPAFTVGLYNQLDDVAVPQLERMKPLCVVFKLGSLASGSGGSERALEAKPTAIGSEGLFRFETLIQACPWTDCLLNRQLFCASQMITKETTDDQSSTMEKLPSFLDHSITPLVVPRGRYMLHRISCCYLLSRSTDRTTPQPTSDTARPKKLVPHVQVFDLSPSVPVCLKVTTRRAKQGIDHNERYNTWSGFCENKLTPLQYELPSQAELYAPSKTRHCDYDFSALDPGICLRCKTVGVLSLQNAQMDEEHEREIEPPPRAKPMKHWLRPHVASFVRTGVLRRLHSGNAFLPVFTTLEKRSTVACGADFWSRSMLVTADLSRPIDPKPTQGSIDQDLRLVQWALSNNGACDRVLILLSPSEADRLMADIRANEHVHPHLYVPRTCQPSDNLKLYSIPPMPWTPSRDLIDQLNVFAGQLYFRAPKESQNDSRIRRNLFSIPGGFEEKEIMFSSPLLSVMALLFDMQTPRDGFAVASNIWSDVRDAGSAMSLRLLKRRLETAGISGINVLEPRKRSSAEDY